MTLLNTKKMKGIIKPREGTTTKNCELINMVRLLIGQVSGQ